MGLLRFVFSVMISRGPEALARDMDDSDGLLMGAHLYCTQDLVNLLLFGRACSNVFDGDRELDGSLRLRGVRERSPVGLLSYFEHCGVHEVGSHLKHPTSPVWVVLCESHYTCIWCTDGASVADVARRPFRLEYYDPLANQAEPIALVCAAAADGAKLDDIPLEWVLRTRWGRVDVDWGDTEKLL